jgi:flagellar assembly factor FliW
MATIDTARFGMIAYEDDKVLRFPAGILGFETMNQFILLNAKEKDSPFKWLQSLDEPALAFLLCDPRIAVPSYWPPVTSGDLTQLELASLSDAVVMSIVTVPEDPTCSTANLQAPVIINASGRLGKQVVTGLPSYKTRQALFLKERQKKTG